MYDAHVTYYQYGLEGNDISGSVLNTLMQAYMAGPYVSELKVGKGMAKVAMREVNWNDCIGLWFLAVSDQHGCEDVSKSINDHLLAVQK